MKRIAGLEGNHKKQRRLGKLEVMTSQEYGTLEVDTRVELIQALIPLGLMHVGELLREEVKTLAGERYAREGGRAEFVRYGSNPGSVRLAGQRLPISIPRVRDLANNCEVPLETLRALRKGGEVDEALLRRVLLGLSCRDYERAAEAMPGAIGLSGSSVSRTFIDASAKKLREFRERDLSGLDIVVLFLDGKTFAADTMVIALGVCEDGRKVPLGFVQTGTENEKVLSEFLLELLDRGLKVDLGVLVVIDGGKGLRAAVRKVLSGRALVQRCQWHKRENVVSYLPKKEQASMRRRLQKAYNKPTYAEAKAALDRVHKELEQRNQSAAASLREGLEETLTLHRLGVFPILGQSLKTTNCLESLNSRIEAYCRKVCHWKNSSQKHRWLAASLLEIEPRLRRVRAYRHLPLLRRALQEELGIKRNETVA